MPCRWTAADESQDPLATDHHRYHELVSIARRILAVTLPLVTVSTQEVAMDHAEAPKERTMLRMNDRGLPPQVAPCHGSQLGVREGLETRDERRWPHHNHVGIFSTGGLV